MYETDEQINKLAMEAHDHITAFFRDKEVPPHIAMMILMAELDAIYTVGYVQQPKLPVE